jgi:histidinol-phosphatase
MKSPYIPVAIQAVKAAEKLIMKYYQSNLIIEIKSDKTPVTVADKEAEETIKQTIRQAFPDHTFYGEEGEKVELSDHKGFTWIIDPIDGTKHFVRGIPLFGTSLALMHDGEIIVGVTNVPALQELTYAAIGEGAYLNITKLQVSDIATIEDAYVNSGRLKYFKAKGNLDQFLELSEKAQCSRGIGDIWSYHLLSQGRIEVMVEASIKFWDIAAAKIIVEEAGGKMTQLDGQSIDYRSQDVLATNGQLHDFVISSLQ